MKLRFLLFALLSAVLFSCTDDEDVAPGAFDISGYWAQGETNDSLSTFQRTSVLSTNQYAFGFESNGKFVESKNSGWCGTPPISYSQYEGTYTINDSLVNITVPFWGGTSHLVWKVISANNNKLVFVQVSYDHLMD